MAVSKDIQISNFTKNHTVGAELLHVDGGQTDLIMKLTVAFCNVANVPKKTDKRTTGRNKI